MSSGLLLAIEESSDTARVVLGLSIGPAPVTSLKNSGYGENHLVTRKYTESLKKAGAGVIFE